MEIVNPGIKPAGAGLDADKLLVCETLADGTQVKFWRYTQTSDGVPTGVINDINLDGTAYTVVDEANVKVCPPEQLVEKTIGRERLSLDDAAAGALTVPADADSAKICVVSGCGFLSDDGTAVLNDGTIGVGVADGALGTVCGDNLADFSAIAAEGETLEIEVTYKQCVVKAQEALDGFKK